MKSFQNRTATVSMLLVCYYPEATDKKILYFCLMGIPAHLQRYKPPQTQLSSPTLTSETEKWITVGGEKTLMEMCWNNWGLSLLFIKGRFHSSYWSSLGSLGIKARIEICKVLFFIYFPHTAGLVSYAHKAFLDFKGKPWRTVTFHSPDQVWSWICVTVHTSGWELS